MKAHIRTNQYQICKQDLEELEILMAIQVFEMQEEIDSCIERFLIHKRCLLGDISIDFPIIDDRINELLEAKIELDRISSELRFEVLGKSEEERG